MARFVLIDHDGVHPETSSPAHDAQIASTLDVEVLTDDAVIRFEATETAGTLGFRVHLSGALFVLTEGSRTVRVFGPAAWCSVDGDKEVSESESSAPWT